MVPSFKIKLDLRTTTHQNWQRKKRSLIYDVKHGGARSTHWVHQILNDQKRPVVKGRDQSTNENFHTNVGSRGYLHASCIAYQGSILCQTFSQHPHTLLENHRKVEVLVLDTIASMHGALSNKDTKNNLGSVMYHHQGSFP